MKSRFALRPSIRVAWLALGMLLLLGGMLACSLVTTRLPDLPLTASSPWSDLIVFVGSDGNIYTTDRNGPGIYRVDASGSEPPVRIADGSLAFWSWK